MNASAIFWVLIGVLLGIAASFVFVVSWRWVSAHPSGEQNSLKQKRTIAIAVVASMAAALSLYGYLGRPDLATGESNHTNDQSATADHGGDMRAVTEQLAQRLAQQGGSDDDWQLLASSYEMLGQQEQADRARRHQLDGQAAPPDRSNDEALLVQAEQLRQQRDYAGARKAFEQLIQSNNMTADAWADYGDVLASQPNGRLSDASVAIDKALALQPQHPKALWLKASLAHEQKRYADSLTIWKQLRQVMKDSPSDARIIDSNIAEAEALTQSTPASTKAIEGQVQLAASLRGKAIATATLFVFARDPAGGPPLAVWRGNVKQWPVKFRLDDSMAMMPNRVLSNAESVIVQARLSLSGNATGSPGDLQTASRTVRIADSGNLHLVIDQLWQPTASARN
jgi:cytochrome c-type biogenesis protein CcmH/NrfG